jgi:hypothetical protein
MNDIDWRLMQSQNLTCALPPTSSHMAVRVRGTYAHSGAPRLPRDARDIAVLLFDLLG